MERQTSNLDLAVIGNSRIGGLIDARASIVWMCVPRFDGDPVFCALLDDNRAEGRFDIEQQDVSIMQAYERNTAILRTEMSDAQISRRRTAWSASLCARSASTGAATTLSKCVCCCLIGRRGNCCELGLHPGHYYPGAR
jgi:hypothetical protein